MIRISDQAIFYDGTPVAAQDVVASFLYVKKTRNILRNMFSWVDRIDIVDSKTIIFRLKKSIPQFIRVLSSSHNAIFKKEFLDAAAKNNSLWSHPTGCGGYKIFSIEKNWINLIPIKEGMKVSFYLVSANQVPINSVDEYDLISLNVTGDLNKMNDFNKIEIFDPYQIYIGLNMKRPAWKYKNERCSFLAKLNLEGLQKNYGIFGHSANEFFPLGTLGYSKNEQYFLSIKMAYKNHAVPKLNSFCLSYLAVSFPEKYLSAYSNMLQMIYPAINLKPILNNKKFGEIFSNTYCDALIFGLKSNNLDGYEFLDVFASKDANFTGVMDNELAKQIKNSQDITNPQARAVEHPVPGFLPKSHISIYQM